MGFFGVPPHDWDSEQVEQWVHSLGFTVVAPTFRANGVVGKDLGILSTEDLTAFGCTAWQVKKIQAELSRMGVQAATGVPVSSTEREAYSPPPAGYPPPAPYYPPHQEYMPPPQQHLQPQYSVPSGLSHSGSMSLSASKELDELKGELAREKLKNDLRQEVDVSSRLAAMEAAARSAAGPTIVSNNNNNSNAAAAAAHSAEVAAAAAAAAASATAKAARAQAKQMQTPQIIGYEKHCGGCSWCIGLFLFPCICCCPVDERPVYGIPGQMHPKSIMVKR